jgi:hypothetical protein
VLARKGFFFMLFVTGKAIIVIVGRKSPADVLNANNRKNQY